MTDDRSLVSLATDVVDQAFFGLMSTVDVDGCPHSRYMAAAMGHAGLRTLYSLTTTGTRKLEHLKANPRVCWTFTSADQSTVVTLTGRARAQDSAIETHEVWDRLHEHAQYYAMDVLGQQEDAEYRALESELDTLELICPTRGLVAPHVIQLSTTRT